MPELRLPQIEVGVAMAQGVLDIFTIADQEVIAELGLARATNSI